MPNGGAKFSNPSKSGDCMTALTIDLIAASTLQTDSSTAYTHWTMKLVTCLLSSAWSIPTKACRKPTEQTSIPQNTNHSTERRDHSPITITSSAKKINDSLIITFNTTIIAPKNRNVSKYNSSLIQNIGALNAKKL